jgi:hypothetical protein
VGSEIDEKSRLRHSTIQSGRASGSFVLLIFSSSQGY